MKKLLISLMLVLLLVSLVACSKPTETEVTNDLVEDNTETAKSEYPFPSDKPEVGGKQIIVSTAAGTTEDGNIPEELISTDTSMTQIGLDIGNMDNEDLNWDGTLEIFIYVNDIFVQREQTSGLYQTSINISDWMLKPGEYTVTAAQFESNDPVSGTVVNLSQVRYKIKN